MQALALNILEWTKIKEYRLKTANNSFKIKVGGKTLKWKHLDVFMGVCCQSHSYLYKGIFHWIVKNTNI